MSSEWDQTCLVCGAKTENRCSSCAEAGIDLFFCSPDHQKLVWKVHGRVCGPGKANPFTWPLLSQLEGDEAVAHMHESKGILASGALGFSTVAEALEHELKIPPERVLAALKLFTASSSRPADAFPFSAQQVVLPLLRAYEAARQNLGETPVAQRQDVILALSASDYLRTRTDDYGEEPWRTLFRHRTLVHIALLDLWATRAGPPALAEWLGRIHERDMGFFTVTVAPGYPDLAEQLVETTEARKWFKVSELALSGFPQM
ncbi:hypothetical protein JCM8208_002838 [Rhodotorula glutinis]